jgi:hypothetical protein
MINYVFYIHIASLCLAGIGIFFADKAAFAWLMGKRETVEHKAVLVAHWIVTTGLVCLILTGLYMFWPLRDYLVGQPLFWLKMLFVAALVINSFFIEHLMDAAVRQSFKSLSWRQKLPLVVSGGVSTLSWLGAGIVALILF